MLTAPTPQVVVSSVTYQELADLEADFDDFDVELLRLQAQKERSLYERRAQLVRRIPHFWPLVFEQAPPEIDQYVQPIDSNVLLSALEDVEVTRFDVGADPDCGDPRSLAFRFTFAPNDLFEDRVLEKRFWHRTAAPAGKDSKDPATANGANGANLASSSSPSPPPAWSGLVSEPVAIRWKKGKDPTAGLLDLAVQVWNEGKDPATEKTALQKALLDKLDKTSIGGVSFFAWFGFVGRRVTADESRKAAADERTARTARAAKRAAQQKEEEKKEKEGKATKKDEGENAKEDDDNDEDEEDDEDDDGYPFEIFPDGDTLAVTLAEDLWPNAIKYFRQAQELDALSDDDFESDADEDQPPSKKQKM